jgi:alkylation response protein AidB-like acyl-CoA dehydrogenase
MTLTAIDIDRLLDEADSGDAAAQAEIAEIIVDLEGARRRSLAAAADGDRVAADPNESQLIRSQAAMAAYYARGHAREYGEEAAALRLGENPWCYEICY